MKQTLSLEANRPSASQEILRILWNQNVHYSFHESQPLVLILSQINPVHAPRTISRRSILIFSYHLFVGHTSSLLTCICLRFRLFLMTLEI
jgi:hypothetical protein